MDAGVGIYRDEDEKTFTPPAIQKAWERLDLGPGDYLTPNGEEEYLGDRVFLQESARLVFGSYANELLENKKLSAVGTPGGTGALALAFEMFRTRHPRAPLLIGMPTWHNHILMANWQKIPLLTYQHVHNQAYDIDAHLTAIKASPQETLVLFHTGKTHNPTGVNPSHPDEWRKLARTMEGRRAFFDTSYAGFENGLVPDTEAIRLFMEEGVLVAVAISYAKNGGLYKERPGALLIPASSQTDAIELQRVLNMKAQVSYSSPPALGERLIAKVFSSPELHQQWNADLQQIAQSLKTRREIFAKELPEFQFLAQQVGLFSMLPLQPEQVEKLKTDFGVYMPSIGRVNFGGVPTAKIRTFAQAIKAVLS